MYYFPDSAAVNGKPDCKGRKGLPMRGHLSNFGNLGWSKLGSPVFCSDRCRAMFSPVALVILRSIPSEIIQFFGGWLTVIMASFHAGRTRTDKGNKHQSVNNSRSIFFILGQRDPIVSVLIKMYFQYFLRTIPQYIFRPLPFPKRTPFPIRTHSSMIRNFVSREPRNLFPLFNVWVKLVITHGQGLLNRLRLWESRRGVRCTVAACFFIT